MSSPGVPETTDRVPEPPAGPGVQPPFTAPPRDQNRRGLWIGLAAAGVAIVVCCVGGVAGFGLLEFASQKQLRTEATATVTSYFQALEDQDYGQAYGYLCTDLRRSFTSAEYADAQRNGPGVRDFDVGAPAINAQVTVPVHVEYTDGTGADRRMALTQEQAASQTLRICGQP